jgi:hypothetical protein
MLDAPVGGWRRRRHRHRTPNLEKEWLPDRRAIERGIEELAAF